MTGVPPTIPFHVAKAYGARAPVAKAPAPPTPAADTAPIAKIAPARPTDDVTLAKPTTDIAELIAARVEEPAVESPAVSQAATGLPFYRHPADQNTAATELNIGRSLDVNG